MASNAQGISWSFKAEALQGIHNLGVGVIRATTAADTIKAALYHAKPIHWPCDNRIHAKREVSGTNYTAGGLTVTNATAPTTAGGSTAYWTPSASITFSSVTLPSLFDTVLFYNSSRRVIPRDRRRLRLGHKR